MDIEEMLQNQITEKTPIKSFARTSVGVFPEHPESFDALILSEDFAVAIENTELSEQDDFGIVTFFPEQSDSSTFTGSDITKVTLSDRNDWVHTDDDQVVHLTVHTTSGKFGVTVYNCTDDLVVPTRKVILKSPMLSFDISI